MKFNLSIIFVIILIFLGTFFIIQQVLAEIAEPTVNFVGGDDTNQNGGTDDAYDSLIIFDVQTSSPADFLHYGLLYSVNNGNTWNSVTTTADLLVINQTTKQYRYYWSTSGIYAPILYFRAYSMHTSGTSEIYQNNNLSLAHRTTNYDNNFFVEDFTTSDFKNSGQTTANWTTTKALVELPWNQQSGRYAGSAEVTSLNLLPENGTIATITKVTLQPVHVDVNQPNYLGYKLSNDGITWYPPGNSWYHFDQGIIVPSPGWEYTFTSQGTKLFWRAELKTNDRSVTPRIYQLRFNYTENLTPQACFTVNPTSNLTDPQQNFLFNGNCSGDQEDPLNMLDFRWDWESDGSWDRDWLAGGYSASHIYNSTSTFTITMEVRDTLGAIDSYQSSINEESLAGNIYGWMWSAINNSDLGYGWTSLNCDNNYYGTPVNMCGASNYGLAMDDQFIWGWAWNPYLGWVCFGDTCDPYGPAPDSTNPQASYSRENGEVNGWGKFIGQGNVGWLQLRDVNWCGPTPETDCTYLDFNLRTLNGFAWAGGKGTDPDDYIGPGWQWFYGQLNLPWLETLYGSIYGRGGVSDWESMQTNAPPSGRYSASYCILAGGQIIGFTSGIDCLYESYRLIDFPSLSNQYGNILGIIDFNRILADPIVSTSSDIDGTLPDVLGGQVYQYTNRADYYIDQPFIIYNAHNLNSSGAGTVVIEGNLRINSNFYYEEAVTTSQIENLASVAWIVKGDVFIDESVSHIAGNFIVLGEVVGSSGVFATGDDSANPTQLVVAGLVMAKEMNWQRTYKSASEPAEQIIYDGRVLVNTPPGLDDLAKTLPIWQETFTTSGLD